MSGRAVLLTMAGLLGLLALEFALAFTALPRLVLPAVGVAMVVVTAFTFMRLRAGGRLSAVFALAAVFWLCVMMGLGSMDPATRADIPVHQTDVRASSDGMPPR